MDAIGRSPFWSCRKPIDALLLDFDRPAISAVIPQSMCQLKRRLMHPSDPERTAMAPAHGLVFSVNAA
jgi:hypothetical protein